MLNHLKLRRIGNSLGTTFSKEVLHQAGLTGDEPLTLVIRPGEIRLCRTEPHVAVAFTPAEAAALAAGERNTPAALAAQAKLQRHLLPTARADNSVDVTHEKGSAPC